MSHIEKQLVRNRFPAVLVFTQEKNYEKGRFSGCYGFCRLGGGTLSILFAQNNDEKPKRVYGPGNIMDTSPIIEESSEEEEHIDHERIDANPEQDIELKEWTIDNNLVHRIE